MSKLFRYLNKKITKRDNIKVEVEIQCKATIAERDKAKRESKRDIQSSSWGQILWAF